MGSGQVGSGGVFESEPRNTKHHSSIGPSSGVWWGRVGQHGWNGVVFESETTQYKTSLEERAVFRHTHAHAHARMHTCTRARHAHAHAHAQTRPDMHARARTRMHTHTHTHTPEGSTLVAAGYCIYAAATTLVITLGTLCYDFLSLPLQKRSSLPLSLSLSLTHTHTLSLSLSLSHTHTFSHTSRHHTHV